MTTDGQTAANHQAALHDAYAAAYDGQVRAYECYLAEVLFGLAYEYIRPGERLLDVGIGSGLSAAPFAAAGLMVYGMDFSPAMLEQCRAKGFAANLRQHDLQQLPWPYADEAVDHLIACGVFHFLPELENIFHESARTLHGGGMMAFTTKSPTSPLAEGQTYSRPASAGGLDIFEHDPSAVEAILGASGFRRLKALRCFVGDDIFHAWVAQKGR